MSDVFNTILIGADFFISLCYNFINITYSQFQSFITGDFMLEFTTFLGNSCSYVVPSFSFVDGILDSILSAVSLLFYPNSYISGGLIADAPMYVCFISFFVNIIFTLALYNLVKTVIDWF